MQSYEIGFPSLSVQKHFKKEISRLDKSTQLHIKAAIDKLTENPRPPGKKFKFLNPPLAVYQYAARYRLRVGDFRILYDVDDKAKRVILLTTRRRSEKTYQ